MTLSCIKTKTKQLFKQAPALVATCTAGNKACTSRLLSKLERLRILLEVARHALSLIASCRVNASMEVNPEIESKAVHSPLLDPPPHIYKPSCTATAVCNSPLRADFASLTPHQVETICFDGQHQAAKSRPIYWQQ